MSTVRIENDQILTQLLFYQLNTNLPQCFQSVFSTSPTTSSVSVDVFTAPTLVPSPQRRSERLPRRDCRSQLTRRRGRRGEPSRPVAPVPAMAGVPGTVWQPRGRGRRWWQPATGRLRHFRLHFLEVSHLINQSKVCRRGSCA